MRWMMALTLLPVVAGAQHRSGREWRVHDEESINRNFDVSYGSGPQKLLVDNISGSVHVTGYSGREVQVKVQKHIGADSNEGIQEAKRDVKLDLSQQGNFVRLYVDGPFRSPNGMNYRGADYYGYEVVFDYDIQVPFATELIVKNVNHGDIDVRKTAGDFEINGVNGGIVMADISGAGTVRTVNGTMNISFTKNPAKSTEFRTVNGKIDVYFQPSLNADLNFHTVNGGLYADFDITSRPPKPVAGENVNGRFLYRSDGRNLEARAGKGGPEFTFNTVNGAVRLHSKVM